MRRYPNRFTLVSFGGEYGWFSFALRSWFSVDTVEGSLVFRTPIWRFIQLATRDRAELALPEGRGETARVCAAIHCGSERLASRLVTACDSSTEDFTRFLSASAKTASRPRCKSNMVGTTT